MKHYYLLLYIVFGCFCYSSAQETALPLRHFYTQQMQVKAESTDGVVEKRSVIEQFTEDAKWSSSQQGLVVPVVFHIIYASGQEYPSNDQIAAQLEALNRDFSATDYYSGEVSHAAKVENNVADVGISFCVPARSPAGKKTTGINLIQTSRAEWGASDEMKSEFTGGSSPWSSEWYLNVWVVHLADSISGWAQMPGGPDYSDGIVIDYRYFGTGGTAVAPYDQGKTLTHLVGNYLNLYDLWNEDNPCADDYVYDTPIHNGPNYHCYKDELHVSLCDNNQVEMTMNFMDNTPDKCMYMFTPGQRQRMRAVLSTGGPRSTLVMQEVKCGKVPQTTSFAPLLGSNLVGAAEVTAQEASETLVKIFPNPASEIANVVVSTERTNTARVLAYDVLGKIIWETERLLPAGQSTIEVPVNRWATGTYYLHTQIEEERFVERLIVRPTKAVFTRQ